MAVNKQINHAVLQTGGSAFNKRATTVTHKTVNTDGTDGADIAADPVPNWLSPIPDYATNRSRRPSVRHGLPVTDGRRRRFFAFVALFGLH